jgi:hypothetical protein
MTHLQHKLSDHRPGSLGIPRAKGVGFNETHTFGSISPWKANILVYKIGRIE